MRGARREIGDPVVPGERAHASGFPHVLSPGTAGVDLAAWARGRADEVQALMQRHGALLFRGFAWADEAAFEEAAAALLGPLSPGYPELGGGLTRSGRTYRPTPYPAHLEIPFHNEGAHRPRFPLRQAFGCLAPPASGGETPLALGRRVLEEMPAALAEALRSRGLLYVRRFLPSLDVPWRTYFACETPAELEARCAALGATITWREARGTGGEAGTRAAPTPIPCISFRCPALRRHPATSQEVLFHQLLAHHPALLPVEVRTALEREHGPEGLSRDVRWGDGAPIADEDARALAAAYERAAVAFPWREGDLVVLDNLLVAHARRAFTGARRVLVALAGEGA